MTYGKKTFFASIQQVNEFGKMCGHEVTRLLEGTVGGFVMFS